MKNRLVLPVLILAALASGGCMSLAKAQLENKIPKVNAQRVSVDVSTIYGVSGTLTEKNVRWDGDTKKVESSELRITSPVGSYHRTIDGAEATLKP